MKINKAKMMVSTLAIIAGAATVGSISGTVAWFQYNTRVTAAYVGTTASVSRNLQIRINDEHVGADETTYHNGNWESDLTVGYIRDYLTAKAALASDNATKEYAKGNGNSLVPVTYGRAKKNEALPKTGAFEEGPRTNPMAGRFEYTDWGKAEAGNYVTLPLEFKLANGAGANLSGKNIYLTDLTFQKHGDDADVSTAIRVHFASTSNQLWSKTGVDVKTSDNLDLNGDGKNDKVPASGDKYNFNETELVDGVYGDRTSTGAKDDTAVVESYNATGTVNTAVRPMANDETDALAYDNAIALGATGTDGTLKVNVTIWFEGWALLTDYKNPDGSVDSAVWAAKFAGQKFDVGMSFATPNVDPVPAP